MNKELTREERYYIYVSIKNSLSISQIARELDRHKSTISREIRRNRGKKGYRYKQAHEKALKRRILATKHRKSDPMLIRHIIKYLKYGFSPEQIVGRRKKKEKGA